MIRRMTEAKTEAQLLPACHALERIITHGHYLIPQWSAGTHRMVYDSWRLVRPAVVPAYAKGESWAMDTWWARMPVLTDRKSTRLNSSHLVISYAVFCLKTKTTDTSVRGQFRPRPTGLITSAHLCSPPGHRTRRPSQCILSPTTPCSTRSSHATHPSAIC